MDYAIEAKDQESIIRLTGRLTFNDHGKLRTLITEMQGSKGKKHVLDLGKLEFVDSAGIGMLLIAHEEMNNADKKLVLRGAAGQVKRVLSVAQLSKIVTVEE